MRLLAAAFATSLALSSIGCTPKVQEGVGAAFVGVGALSAVGGAAWCKYGCHEPTSVAGSLGMIGGGVVVIGLGAAIIASKNGSSDPPPPPPPREPTFSPPPM